MLLACCGGPALEVGEEFGHGALGVFGAVVAGAVDEPGAEEHDGGGCGEHRPAEGFAFGHAGGGLEEFGDGADDEGGGCGAEDGEGEPEGGEGLGANARWRDGGNDGDEAGGAEGGDQGAKAEQEEAEGGIGDEKGD